VGVLDAINGFMIIYASPSDRTPPVLQPVLGNTAIIWSILLSKYHVSNLRKRAYCNSWVIMAIVLVMGGVAMMVVPVIIAHGLDDLGGLNQVGWITVFIVGVIPGAWYNVMQQRALDHMSKKREEKGVTGNYFFNEDHSRDDSVPLIDDKLMIKLESYYGQLDIWFVLSISCIIQLGFVFLCFWVNFIPWFGFGLNLHLFDTIKCYFGMFEECHNTWWIGLIFLSSYLLSYFTSIVINETSANYNEFIGSLIAPLSVAFWYIFPSVVEAPVDPPPLWAASIALVLLTIATFMWRWWEKDQENMEDKSETMN